MKKLNMERAIERYNGIMMKICVEHRTINTRFSQDTENYNLRDMVAEADYWLGCYYERGNCRYEDRFESKEDYKDWLSETGKLKRFINAYQPFVVDLTCNCSHCSRFD